MWEKRRSVWIWWSLKFHGVYDSKNEIVEDEVASHGVEPKIRDESHEKFQGEDVAHIEKIEHNGDGEFVDSQRK